MVTWWYKMVCFLFSLCFFFLRTHRQFWGKLGTKIYFWIFDMLTSFCVHKSKYIHFLDLMTFYKLNKKSSISRIRRIHTSTVYTELYVDHKKTNSRFVQKDFNVVKSFLLTFKDRSTRNIPLLLLVSCMYFCPLIGQMFPCPYIGQIDVFQSS